MGELRITLPAGGTAVVKGTPAEIAEVLQLTGLARAEPSRLPAGREAKPSGGRVHPAKSGPQARVGGLIDEGFFKAKHSLAGVLDELKRNGHAYRPGDLSPVMVRLVRARRLRRAKDTTGRWLYSEW